MSVRSNELSSIDRLRSMVKAKAASPTRTSPPGHRSGADSGNVLPPSPRPAPKGEFVLGQKPVPTGPTAHEIMTKPDHQATLKDVIAEHQKANPGRALKAPALVSIWNAKNPKAPLNDARARSVIARVHKARDSYVDKQVKAFMRSGAAATLKKT
jgi:hypothetical protein